MAAASRELPQNSEAAMTKETHKTRNLSTEEKSIVRMAASIFASRKISEVDALKEARDLLGIIDAAEMVLTGEIAAIIFSGSSTPTTARKEQMTAAVTAAQKLIQLV
jgi:hypothetical protein